MPLAGVCQETLRLLLEHGAHRQRGHVLLHRRNGLDQVAAHEEVEAAGGEQEPIVHLRPAWNDRHVQAVAGIGAVGDGLVEAAMFRLRDPVCAERHFLQRLAKADARRGERRCEAGKEGAAGGHGGVPPDMRNPDRLADLLRRTMDRWLPPAPADQGPPMAALAIGRATV